MTSYQRKSPCGDKTILRPSHLHNGISYTGKMTFLYWIRALYFICWGTQEVDWTCTLHGNRCMEYLLTHHPDDNLISYVCPQLLAPALKLVHLGLSGNRLLEIADLRKPARMQLTVLYMNENPSPVPHQSVLDTVCARWQLSAGGVGGHLPCGWWRYRDRYNTYRRMHL